MLRRLSLLIVLWLASLPARPSLAERPTAPQLLPDRTVALVRIRSFPESRAKFMETAMGRILTDPEVGPLISELYDQAQQMYTQVEERVGVPLDQLLKLPQGEVWIAVVPPAKDGPVAVALLIDVEEQLPTATKLIERGEEYLKEQGGSKVEETLADAKVNIFVPAGADQPRRETKRDKDGKEWEELVVGRGTMVEFEKDGAIVVTTTATLAEEILRSLSGEKTPSLAENERFAAVMSRCTTGQDPPGFEWYVDPISAAKALARGNVAAQTGLALIPALGLDGLQAVGGTMTFSTGEYDGIAHTHVLLEDPKSGVMELLQMSAGDSTPEPWVPTDTITYMTLHWDLQTTYGKGTKVYDGFFGEGKAAEEIRNRVKNLLDVDFETDVLPALDGRATLISWNEPPARLNSQANMIGIKLTDPKRFEETLGTIMAKHAERIEKKTFGSTVYYQLDFRIRRREREEDAPPIREPEPCFAIVGDYLLLTDSVKFLEHSLTAVSTGKSLANELDYKLIASKISRQVGGQKPGMVIFSRPEEGLRMLYELATSEDTRRRLEQQGQGSDFFKRLDESLKEHPLPPFPVIAKYLAPSGAMVTQDETGFHYMSFTLKRK